MVKSVRQNEVQMAWKNKADVDVGEVASAIENKDCKDPMKRLVLCML